MIMKQEKKEKQDRFEVDDLLEKGQYFYSKKEYTIIEDMPPASSSEMMSFGVLLYELFKTSFFVKKP
jgi:hypothetical protein